MISFYNKQETYFQNLVLCGIIFENETNLDKELKYKLRFPSTPKHAARDPMRPIRTWWTQFTFPLFSKPGPRQAGNFSGGVPGYYEEGFLAVQHAVAMTVASYINNSKEDIDEHMGIYLQRFPYPPYIEDIFLLALQFLFPIILMLSFIYPAVNLTKNLVIEKEKRLKESMKMMGLKNWLHWFAWFIKSFTWLAISSGLLSILITMNIKEGVGILNKSNGLLIYFFFISYAISCIAFCFMLSTFFSKVSLKSMKF
jgi:ATP-binding cassette subfamily A (ABC1) protein 3